MKYIHQKMEKKIESWLGKPEAIFLFGARQVGKTTFLQKIALDLESQGKPTFYVNFDDLKIRSQAKEGSTPFLKGFS